MIRPIRRPAPPLRSAFLARGCDRRALRGVPISLKAFCETGAADALRPLSLRCGGRAKRVRWPAFATMRFAARQRRREARQRVACGLRGSGAVQPATPAEPPLQESACRRARADGLERGKELRPDG